MAEYPVTSNLKASFQHPSNLSPWRKRPPELTVSAASSHSVFSAREQGLLQPVRARRLGQDVATNVIDSVVISQTPVNTAKPASAVTLGSNNISVPIAFSLTSVPNLKLASVSSFGSIPAAPVSAWDGKWTGSPLQHDPTFSPTHPTQSNFDVNKLFCNPTSALALSIAPSQAPSDVTSPLTQVSPSPQSPSLPIQAESSNVSSHPPDSRFIPGSRLRLHQNDAPPTSGAASNNRLSVHARPFQPRPSRVMLRRPDGTEVQLDSFKKGIARPRLPVIPVLPARKKQVWRVKEQQEKAKEDVDKTIGEVKEAEEPKHSKTSTTAALETDDVQQKPSPGPLDPSSNSIQPISRSPSSAMARGPHADVIHSPSQAGVGSSLLGEARVASFAEGAETIPALVKDEAREVFAMLMQTSTSSEGHQHGLLAHAATIDSLHTSVKVPVTLTNIGTPDVDDLSKDNLSISSMTEEQVSLQLGRYVTDFLRIRDLDEGETYLHSLPSGDRWRIVYRLVSSALLSAGAVADAKLVGKLFSRAAPKDLISPEAFDAGFFPVLEIIDVIALHTTNAISLLAIMLKATQLDEKQLDRLVRRAAGDSSEILLALVLPLRETSPSAHRTSRRPVMQPRNGSPTMTSTNYNLSKTAVWPAQRDSYRPDHVSIRNKPISQPDSSALATGRFIEDLSSVSYPEGIKSPSVELNASARRGKFRYDRDFLMQFMQICKDKPDNLPPIYYMCLEPSEQGAGTPTSYGGLQRPFAMDPPPSNAWCQSKGLALSHFGGAKGNVSRSNIRDAEHDDER
ncbi:hypothetical protein DAEQUDRAFT_705318 [Daedalea quercina L-15889]|uniref:Eukaryotic translation initiation factor 4G1 eIF4E-binding domain-containing protein n=1 Tax=Daedalea quercina L-15889 TaxID=1314783 RepID=A0A165SNI5_9APHY|nr:hypothetical protein DAEQUDRAFT_705318 [Daedalea quercina L-15889]